MNRLYHHHDLWEDHERGFYAQHCDNEPGKCANAAALLADVDRFEEVARRVVTEWTHATDVNLSNSERNRNAWLGQASALYAYRVPAYCTKRAWHTLTADQQEAANQVAERVIAEWEVTRFHAETLFG